MSQSGGAPGQHQVQAGGTAMTQAAPRPYVNGQVLLILVTVFLNIMGLGLILPVLPFYGIAYGADSTQIGLLFTAFSACQFLASPIFGALSDRLGRRPIILFGVLGQGLAYVLMGSATSIGMLFVSRIFSGLTAGNISATQAYVADVTRPEERTKAYGLVGAAFGGGLLFGPALGGVLSLIDPRAPAYGAAALLGLNFVFGYFLLRESLPGERRTPKPLREQVNPIGVLVPLIRRPVLRGPLLAIFLLNVALTGFQANFAVFAEARFGLGPTEVSALFVATGLANVLVQLLLLPRLSARFGDSALILVGAAGYAAGNLGTAFAPVQTAFWGTLPALTGGYSLTRGPITSLVTKLVAPWEQGLANGGIQATISLAGVVGPLWAGFAFERLGQPAPYWTSAVAVALAAAAVMLRTRPAPSLAQAPAAAPIQPAALPESTPAVMLQGSLENLGLVPLMRFLSTADVAGCLHLSRAGWNGQLWLEHGRLVAASFGKEHGLPALDAIMLVLTESYFTFAASGPASDGAGALQVAVDDLAGYPARASTRQRGLAAAIPAPGVVPHVVRPAELDANGDAHELVIRLSTLRTLLTIDGERTIDELSDRRPSAELLLDLAALMDLGLVQFESRPARAAQLVA